MIILSHRGYWKVATEKNTHIAFCRSFAMGFGLETDVRDCGGELVISHDPPTGTEMTIQEFCEVRTKYADVGPLALNIKSDGLERRLSNLLVSAGLMDNCFVFDMSVPDALGYCRTGFSTFTRQSEEEPECAFYQKAAGVWMDAFYSDWFGPNEVQKHLDGGKRVCIVSPELHGRDHRQMWSKLAEFPLRHADDLMLCTDRPDEASAFFAKRSPNRTESAL